MAFCPNCGAQSAGAFCPNCGSAASAASGSAAGVGSAGASYVPPVAVGSSSMSDNVAAALCYLFGLITGIIFLLISPYNQNKTIRFHAFQSIFLTVAVIVIEIAWSIVSVITHGIGFLFYPLLLLFFFAVWLYMMYSAYTNKRIKLPLIGDLAEKQA